MATLEVCGLTKHFGDVAAVDDLTFTPRPGFVTGFLGHAMTYRHIGRSAGERP